MTALRVSGFDDLNQFSDLLRKLSGEPPQCNTTEKELFIARTMEANNIRNNIAVPDREDIKQLLQSVLNP
jgi:hypothetical protein